MADDDLPTHELDQYRAAVRDTLAAVGLKEVAFVTLPTNEELASITGFNLVETLIERASSLPAGEVIVVVAIPRLGEGTGLMHLAIASKDVPAEE